jgi:D-3-phosphoglycerate dehydrogenase
MTRILITTTSYQDTPGEHHALLEEAKYEIVRGRGPLNEESTLDLVGDVDGMICGDDEITRRVMEKALPRLRVISKYGIGVDKIDVEAATDLGIPVLFTPGVNHTTVAEHTFLLLLCLMKNLVEEAGYTSAGEWKRVTGNEIMGKKLGIIGLGRIGKEVATRARAFGMEVMAYDVYWDDSFAAQNNVERAESMGAVFRNAEVVSLHTNLTNETRGIVNAGTIESMKDGVVIINCSRGEVVDSKAMAEALETGKVGGYGADVLEREPPPPNHPLLKAKNCLVTPHIASRTYESVERQATMCTRNLILAINGEQPLAQVNDVPIRTASESCDGGDS